MASQKWGTLLYVNKFNTPFRLIKAFSLSTSMASVGLGITAKTDPSINASDTLLLAGMFVYWGGRSPCLSEC